MRLSRSRAIIALAIPVLLGGCAYHSVHFPIGLSHGSTSPDQVAIVEAASPGKPYDIVGKVHAHCRWNWFFAWASCRKSTLKAKLKEQAAALGANAIMSVESDGFSKFEWTNVHYSAAAIRWR